MMPHPTLLKIQAKLPNFFTYFRDDNILAISEDNMQLPICFLVLEKKKVMIFLAVDYPNSIKVAHIVLASSSIVKSYITNTFYISMTNGATYLDDEAYDRWDLESINLNELEPESKERH